jgi:hypothetical protein
MRPTFMVMLFAAGAGIVSVSGVSAAPVINGALVGDATKASQLIQQVRARKAVRGCFHDQSTSNQACTAKPR